MASGFFLPGWLLIIIDSRIAYFFVNYNLGYEGSIFKYVLKYKHSRKTKINTLTRHAKMLIFCVELSNESKKVHR